MAEVLSEGLKFEILGVTWQSLLLCENSFWDDLGISWVDFLQLQYFHDKSTFYAETLNGVIKIHYYASHAS